MFYSVNSYSTSTTRKGVGGLMSGLDTDELVKQMTSGTRSKIATQLQKKQSAQWKQTAYREVISSVETFRNKWFSASSTTNNIFGSAFFNTKKISNLSQYVKVSGNTDAAQNIVIKDILQTAETSSFTSNKNVSSGVIATGKVSASWDQSKVSGKSVTLEYGGTAYALRIGDSFSFANGLSNDGKLQAVVDEFNKAISESDALKGKVEFKLDSGSIQINSLDGTTNMAVRGGDEDFLKSLGLSVSSSTGSTAINGGAPIVSDMFEVKQLADALEGSTLTVSFNGVDKQIKFNASEKADYADPAKLATYMQKQFDKLYGAGKVVVAEGSGTLNFATSDTRDTLTFRGSDKDGVLTSAGALHMAQGTSNRISWTSSIDTLISTAQFPGGFPSADADGNYKLKINDVEIVVNKKETMRDLMSKINDSDAGVRITYSTTSDAFSMVAKDSGAIGKVNVQSTGDPNDIGAMLFGTTSQQQHTTGRDALLEVSFDGGKTSSTINRSSNTFSLDGLNIEILGKADDKITGSKLSFTLDGASHSFTLPSDFQIDYTQSASDQIISVANQLNKQIAAAGVDPDDVRFNVVGGKIAMESVNGKNISLDTSGSSKVLLDTLGFDTVAAGGITGNGTSTVTGNGVCQSPESTKDEIKFNVENDTEAFVKKFKEFTEDYNKMIKLCNDKTTEKRDRDYYPLTAEQKEDMSEDEIKIWETEAKKGILMNDRYLGEFMTGMRQALFAPVGGAAFSLSKMGISTTEWEENGQIHIVNENLFGKAIAENSEQIIKMFTTVVEPDIPDGVSASEKKRLQQQAAMKSGIATRLDFLMNATTGTTGGEGTLVRIAGNKSDYKLSQDNISREIRKYDSNLSNLKKRLKAEEERYYKQFTTLETSLNKMQSQSSWLTDQFGGSTQ